VYGFLLCVCMPRRPPGRMTNRGLVGERACAGCTGWLFGRGALCSCKTCQLQQPSVHIGVHCYGLCLQLVDSSTWTRDAAACQACTAVTHGFACCHSGSSSFSCPPTGTTQARIPIGRRPLSIPRLHVECTRMSECLPSRCIGANSNSNAPRSSRRCHRRRTSTGHKFAGGLGRRIFEIYRCEHRYPIGGMRLNIDRYHMEGTMAIGTQRCERQRYSLRLPKAVSCACSYTAVARTRVNSKV
jgi:hypothetical protein